MIATPRSHDVPTLVTVPMDRAAHATVATWLRAKGLAAPAAIVTVGDPVLLCECAGVLERDIKRTAGRLRVARLGLRLVELLATHQAVRALDAVDAYRLSDGCEDCMLAVVAGLSAVGERCDACEARMATMPTAVRDCASCEGSGKNTDDTSCPDCDGVGLVFAATGEPARLEEVPVDDPVIEEGDVDGRPGPSRCTNGDTSAREVAL